MFTNKSIVRSFVCSLMGVIDTCNTLGAGVMLIVCLDLTYYYIDPANPKCTQKAVNIQKDDGPQCSWKVFKSHPKMFKFIHLF